MMYLLIAAAITLPLTLVTTDAQSAEPVQIINKNYIINNNCNHNHGPNVRRGGHGYDHGHRPYYRRTRHSRGFETHDAAVARIKATHSRFRTYYHPRSNFNSPPHYYDWRGRQKR